MGPLNIEPFKLFEEAQKFQKKIASGMQVLRTLDEVDFGCTEKEDLLPIVSLQGGKAVITLRRIDEDTCRRPQDEGVELKWSFDELGLPAGSPVVVNNPYQLPSGG